jgi:hypothetical protein
LIKSFTQTIGYVIFKKIFLGYLVIVLFISIYQSLEEIKDTKDIIKKNVITIEKVFATQLTEAIVNKEYFEISKLLHLTHSDFLYNYESKFSSLQQ